MKEGLNTALQVCVAFLAHGGECHQNRSLYGTIKWSTCSYNQVKRNKGHGYGDATLSDLYVGLQLWHSFQREKQTKNKNNTQHLQ